MVPPGRNVADYGDAGEELPTALSPWRFGTAHPGFQGPADATVSATQQAFDRANYEQLQALKAKYDPYNKFRINHNIPPSKRV